MFSPFSINEPAVCKNVKFENLIKNSDPNIEKKTSFKKNQKKKRKSIFQYNFMAIEHNYILQAGFAKVWQSCPRVRNWDRGCEIQKLEKLSFQ